MSSLEQLAQRARHRTRLAVADGLPSHSTMGATLTELPISSISRARARLGHRDVAHLDPAERPPSRPRASSSRRSDVQPGQDVVELRVREHAVGA